MEKALFERCQDMITDSPASGGVTYSYFKKTGMVYPWSFVDMRKADMIAIIVEDKLDFKEWRN